MAKEQRSLIWYGEAIPSSSGPSPAPSTKNDSPPPSLDPSPAPSTKKEETELLYGLIAVSLAGASLFLSLTSLACQGKKKEFKYFFSVY